MARNAEVETVLCLGVEQIDTLLRGPRSWHPKGVALIRELQFQNPHCSLLGAGQCAPLSMQARTRLRKPSESLGWDSPFTLVPSPADQMVLREVFMNLLK